MLVFSEIYYPGWTATVDGKPVEVGRVNYVLRAINVKGGHHKVKLEFRPETVTNTESIAFVALALLFILVVYVLGVQYKKHKAAKATATEA